MTEEEMKELELENERLKEENEKLRELEEYRKSLPFKERMYDRINVSVRTLDIIIGVLVVLFILVIILGRQ